MLSPRTKTDIAKIGLNMIVAGQVTGIVETQLEERTEVDTDNTFVHVGCVCTGYLVANKVRPQTDALVDKTAARYRSWKLNRKAKKDAKDK